MKTFSKIQVDDLIGIPFKLGGKDHKGIDCYGLVQFIYKREKGIFLPEVDHGTYEGQVVDGVIKKIRGKFERIECPETLSIVTFSIKRPYVHHVGVVLNDTNKFIHVLSKRFVTVERLNSIEWEPKIRGYYNWKIN